MKSKKTTPPRSVFVPDPATDPARLDAEAARLARIALINRLAEKLCHSTRDRLIALRLKLGLSVIALEKRSGVDKKSIYGLESGKTQPTLILAARLSYGMGTPVSEAIDEGPLWIPSRGNTPP